MAKESGKSIIVTVGDEALADIHDLAKKLVAKGMSVAQVLPLAGIISGTIDPFKMAGLKKINGVLGVEEEVRAQLPPPGGPQ